MAVTMHIVEFEPGDVDNPRNWPRWKKLLAWLPLVVLLDNASNFLGSGYSPSAASFAKSFGVSGEVAVLGLSMHVLGLALGPMVNAPLSEYAGRVPVYVGSYALMLPLLVGSALTTSLGGFLVLRVLTGFFCSVTIANIGGTIADLYAPRATGYPVSIWMWAATGGSPLGYVLLSLVAQYRPYNDTFWALLGIAGGAWVLTSAALLWCGETRHSVILRRRAAQYRRQGDAADVAPQHRPKSAKQLLGHTLTRALRFVATEPVVMFGALYNGYLFGLNFLLNGAFVRVFGAPGHGFDQLQVGLCYLGIYVGVCMGLATNIYQERYYQRRMKTARGRSVAEARLLVPKVAAVAFPVSLFWFAWTTAPAIPAVVPVLATMLWGWSFYTLVLMTYLYTEDAYKQFAASALAGLGLVRNLAGAGFPLFGPAMYANEGDQWAGSILAFLALATVPIPFVLERYGERMRRTSPWASQHLHDEDED